MSVPMRASTAPAPGAPARPARRLGLWTLLLLAGCGRFDFDDQTFDDPGALTYPESVHAVLGVTLLKLVPPTRAGARMEAFSITPDLPAGVTLDPITGTISGIATAAVPRTRFTVTASAAAPTRAQRAPSVQNTQQRTASFWLTALPGYEVTSTRDAPDDDAGQDGVCHSSVAGGCTLRAAVQSIKGVSASKLVLLQAGTYTLESQMSTNGGFILAGQDAASTIVRPLGIHPGYRLFALGEGAMRLEDATFQDFGSADGGVVRVEGGQLSAYACAFRNNVATSTGGVLFADAGAVATLESCTFTGNRATSNNGWGGVIDAEGAGTRVVVRKSLATGNLAIWGSFSHITSGTSLLLENSTLHGNTATRAGTLASPGGLYTLVNDTIVYNTNTFDDSAGLYLFSVPAEYSLTNTLVAYNTARSGKENNCSRNDLGTALKSGGGNLFSDDAGNCASFLSGDKLKVSPGLDPSGPLDHGGLTATYALAPGSPALNTAVAAACPAEDQRGLPRPAQGGCDVGAFEQQ